MAFSKGRTPFYMFFDHFCVFFFLRLILFETALLDNVLETVIKSKGSVTDNEIAPSNSKTLIWVELVGFHWVNWWKDILFKSLASIIWFIQNKYIFHFMNYTKKWFGLAHITQIETHRIKFVYIAVNSAVNQMSPSFFKNTGCKCGSNQSRIADGTHTYLWSRCVSRLINAKMISQYRSILWLIGFLRLRYGGQKGESWNGNKPKKERTNMRRNSINLPYFGRWRHI